MDTNTNAVKMRVLLKNCARKIRLKYIDSLGEAAERLDR